LDAFRPDACIFDFWMPHRTGADLLDLVKQKDPKVEVIFLTAQDEASLAVDLMKRGAVDFLLKPVELNQLLLSIARALEHRRLVVENEKYRLHLEQLVMEKTHALNEALTGLNHVHTATLDALSMALDFRDQSTSGHSRRVADLTAGAVRGMGIKDAALVQIEHGALLHDIGKLRIPESILWKPAKLTEDEWQTMRRHPEIGKRLIEGITFLRGAVPIVYCHHEKWDGSGYPRGLTGDEIPLGARIFSVVDAFDAMTFDRPYSKAIPFDAAQAEIKRCAGSHFDPAVVEAFLRVPDVLLEEIRRKSLE